MDKFPPYTQCFIALSLFLFTHFMVYCCCSCCHILLFYLILLRIVVVFPMISYSSSAILLLFESYSRALNVMCNFFVDIDYFHYPLLLIVIKIVLVSFIIFQFYQKLNIWWMVCLLAFPFRKQHVPISPMVMTVVVTWDDIFAIKYLCGMLLVFVWQQFEQCHMLLLYEWGRRIWSYTPVDYMIVRLDLVSII